MTNPAARFKWGGWIGFALLAFIVYQSWVNSQLDPKVQVLSGQFACSSGTGCVVEGDNPLRFESSAFLQRYTWKTSLGEREVVCRRAQIWLGAWRCKAEAIPTPADATPEVKGPKPADQGRGAPGRSP